MLGINTSSPQHFPPDFSAQSARVIIRPRVLTVPSNHSVVVRVRFIRPARLNLKRLPVYSGYIRIHGSKGETFNVPYAGVGTRMKGVSVTDFKRGSPYISRESSTDANPISITTNEVFQFPAEPVYIHLRLAMGSSLVRVDVLGSGNKTMVAGTKILGSIDGYPLHWQSRDGVSTSGDFVSSTVSSWSGILSGNKTLQEGCYRLLYRALKIFGNPEKKNDYESWISRRFCVKY